MNKVVKHVNKEMESRVPVKESGCIEMPRPLSVIIKEIKNAEVMGGIPERERYFHMRLGE